MDIDNEIKELKDLINELANKIKNNNSITDELIKKITLINHELDNIKYTKSTESKIKLKGVLRSTLSCLLSVCLLSSLFFIGKELTKTKIYNEEIKTYNEDLDVLSDRTIEKNSVYIDNTNNKDIIKLKIYDKWYETENGYSRKYQEFDLSSYGDQEISYYLDNIIKKMNDTAKIYIENKDKVNSYELYNNIKYEISKIDLTDYKYVKKDIDILIVLLILSIITLLSEVGCVISNKNFGIISSWIYLFRNKEQTNSTDIENIINIYQNNIISCKERIDKLLKENIELAKKYDLLLKNEDYKDMLDFIHSYSSEINLDKEISKSKKRINTLIRK